MATPTYNPEESSADRNVEIWKIKKLIKSLEAARGCETVFIPVRETCRKLGEFNQNVAKNWEIDI